jgi:hypothetical protein
LRASSLSIVKSDISLARYISSARLQPNVTIPAQGRRLKKIDGD